MKKILVLGAGPAGRQTAMALSEKFDVTAADIQLCFFEMLSLAYPIIVTPCSFKDKVLLHVIIQPFNFIANTFSAVVGFETFKTIIEEKKNAIHLSDFREDIFLPDELAKRNKVSVIKLPFFPGHVKSLILLLNFILEDIFRLFGIYDTTKHFII